MAAIKYWVWLSDLRMRPKAKCLLLEHFHGDPMELYYAEDKYLRSVPGIAEHDLSALGRRELDSAGEILARCEMAGISIVTLQDAAYPRRLGNIYDPPVALYVKGRLPAMDEEPAIAVIGTRKPTPYGISMGQRMGYEITKCGGLVVSGLTQGVDRMGAIGALRAGGRVVGVLGTGPDAVSDGLYADVAAAGALVSEYPPGSPVFKANFRQRNRVTAGLSEGVVVVEAPERSGTQLFVDEALDQGKEVFAVPGNADAPNSVGTNRMIRDGAKAVTGGWDVMCEFEGLYRGKICRPDRERLKFPREERLEYADFVKVREPSAKKVIDKEKREEYIDLKKQLEGLTRRQLEIVTAMTSPSTHIDDLIERTKLDAPTVLAELTMLEIEGVVTQEPGKRFTLNIIKR